MLDWWGGEKLPIEIYVFFLVFCLSSLLIGLIAVGLIENQKGTKRNIGKILIIVVIIIGIIFYIWIYKLIQIGVISYR